MFIGADFFMPATVDDPAILDEIHKILETQKLTIKSLA